MDPSHGFSCLSIKEDDITASDDGAENFYSESASPVEPLSPSLHDAFQNHDNQPQRVQRQPHQAQNKQQQYFPSSQTSVLHQPHSRLRVSPPKSQNDQTRLPTSFNSSLQKASVTKSRPPGPSRGSLARSKNPSEGPKNIFGGIYPATKGNFPRISPLNIPINTQREDQKVRNLVLDTSLLYLREEPEDDERRSHMGIYLWPPDDVGVKIMRKDDPRLDEIRKKHGCHLVLKHNPKRLCIYPTDAELVDESISNTIQAIRNVLQESLQQSSRCVRFILANPPYEAESEPNVRMVTTRVTGVSAARATRINECNGKIALVEPPMLSFDSNWEKHSALALEKNTLTLQLAVGRGLERLVASPGRIEIRALIGSFVFTRLAMPRNTAGEDLMLFGEFCKSLRSTRCQGILLRLRPDAELFQRILARPDLFEGFIDGESCALEAVRPTYVGVFTFNSDSPGDSVNRQFTIETGTKLSEDGTPTVIRRDWTSPFEIQSSRRLEAYVATLDGGLSWKLEAVAHPYCRTICDNFQRFQTKVAPMKPTAAPDKPGSTELMFRFPPGNQQSDFYQRTQWKFFFKRNSNYIVQVSRLDRFNTMPIWSGQHKASDTDRRSPVQTEWEASIYDERWDETLGQNAALNLGECANWEPSIAKFFPSDKNVQKGPKAGFANFVKCVNEVCRGLSKAKPW